MIRMGSREVCCSYDVAILAITSGIKVIARIAKLRRRGLSCFQDPGSFSYCCVRERDGSKYLMYTTTKTIPRPYAWSIALPHIEDRLQPLVRFRTQSIHPPLLDTFEASHSLLQCAAIHGGQDVESRDLRIENRLGGILSD